jgi:hypothetical protein
MRELLIGCGNRRKKVLHRPGHEAFDELTTLDIDPDCGADVIHDLNVLPYPFEDDTFDEIHAYEVLEHTGQQGDWRFFFAQFSEFWRIMRNGGLLFASSPSVESPWLWGDPGHTRAMQPQSLYFLDQTHYAEVGTTAMTDYRHVWKGDFQAAFGRTRNGSFEFAIRAIKPARDAAATSSETTSA